MLRSYILSAIAVLWLAFATGLPHVPASSLGAATAQDQGMLILNEIGAWPEDSEVWVELLNRSDAACPLDGWSISFLSGASGVLPADAPGCPAGGVVLVTIGTGAASSRIDGQTVRVRIPMTGGLNPDGDGCTLIGPSGPVDALAWGNPPDGLYLPIPVGPPLNPQIEVIHDEGGLFQPGDVCIRYPGTIAASTENWTIRDSSAASPGERNPPPPPLGLYPVSGSRMASGSFHLFAVGLDWARQFTFQVATSDSFEDIVLDETVDQASVPIDGLPAGTYYWRVRGISTETGPWSGPQQLTIEAFDIDTLIRRAEMIEGKRPPRHSDPRLALRKGGGEPPEDLPVAPLEQLLEWHCIGCTHIQQRKDTDMVCLDGCRMDGEYPWDAPHPIGDDMRGGHKEIYCSRACISMIAALGGCTLSQDRITFYLFEEAGGASASARSTRHIGDPLGDLGHGKGLSGPDICLALEWLYGQGRGTARWDNYTTALFNDNHPADMDTVKEFIDNDRPVICDIGWRLRDLHSTLVDGYAIIRGPDGTVTNYVHVLDPWLPDEVNWEVILENQTRYTEFPPTSGRPMRCDEPTISSDSDGDAVVDFDETNRFHTNPNNTDSDGDGLDDKFDMLGYLFTVDGVYRLRERDIDRDDAAKELDPDNDRIENNGLNDGCEDADGDGFPAPDGSESDCFVAGDDFTVPNPECFLGYIRIEGWANLIQPGISVPVRTSEVIYLTPEASGGGEGYGGHHEWRITGETTIPVPGIGSISSRLFGEGEGSATVTIEVDETGHYRMVADTDPRQGTYTITTGGIAGVAGRSNTYPFFFGLADHHYEYVSPETPGFMMSMLYESGKPNIFEGQVTNTEDGQVRIAGEDTMTLPDLGNIEGGTDRTWDIAVE